MKIHFEILLALAVPACATVRIVSFAPSPAAPQPIGTPIHWTVTATDSHPGPLTFRFNVGPVNTTPSPVKDFNVGTLNAGKWTAQPFTWFPTGPEGGYSVQVIAKDFATGETDSRTVQFTVTPLVTGSSPVAAITPNPLVALFSAPACAAGSSMRVSFRQQSAGAPVSATNWVACHPPTTMTFEVAGMYPATPYLLHAQTRTSGSIANGPNVKFTTGPLPTTIPFPAFHVIVPGGPATDSSEPVLLWGLSQLGMETMWRDVATDLAGNITWFYATTSQHPDLLTRPLAGGGMLTIQDNAGWDPSTQNGQLLRQIDLAGNVTRETNIGAVGQQLLALGAVDAGPCYAIPRPAPVGSACLGGFHHEAIALPNGGVAVLASIEKIFPPGTQGDTSGLPVDVVGDMVIVLDSNWQAAWYFDAFDQLDPGRAAILGETCSTGEAGCPPVLLLGSGIAPLAKDWLHANSLYYWAANGDLICSLKDQDWVIRIDYANGAHAGSVLWRMGPGGDFIFNNVAVDPWPWFSHQHDVTLTDSGAMLVFDNGDTRVALPPVGLGPGCGPADCNSRGMSLVFNQANLTVQPVMSLDLGVYSPADGAAQLLANGNYFFAAPLVISLSGVDGYAIETGSGGQALNIQGPQGYRGFRLASLYSAN